MPRVQRRSAPAKAGPAALPLATLADTSSITSVDALATRVETLNALFNARGDRRGLFTAVYAPCLRRLAQEIPAGRFKDRATTERVVLALGKAYLEGLGRDGKGPPGGRGSAWDTFTRLAADPSVSDARLLASSINAHWSADLPEALKAGRAPAGYEPDFQEIGRVLVDEVTQQLRRPRGPNGRRVAAVFKDQAALSALSSVFGLRNVMDTGMHILLAEAFATSRLPPALAGAEHLTWSVREGLINML